MQHTRRFLSVGVVLVGSVGALLGLVWLLQPAQAAPIAAQISVTEAVNSQDAGFARVTEPRTFTFPADHGPHPEYATEWWYYTGNLDSADGRHFGFQLTFFRRGLSAAPAERASDWATSNIYMAHFAVTDVQGAQFFADDRFSRDGAGLAGAQADPFRVWTGDWEASDAGADGMRLRAANGAVAIDLVARSTKPAVLQGDNGVSQKSDQPGNASYYYSLTRMATDGTVSVNGQSFTVTGTSWMDREWSTSALGQDQIGWDWFALHLNDQRDLMYYQVRRRDGSADPLSSGTLVAADGTGTAIRRDDVQIEVLERWTSPDTHASYPSRWRLRLPRSGLDLTIEPYIPDQELRLAVVYWEGAVRFTGTRDGQPVSGTGYIELTGYGDPQRAAVPARAQ